MRLMVRLARLGSVLLRDGDDERDGGGLERELKGGKGRRENERGEARRAREASVVSVRPL